MKMPVLLFLAAAATIPPRVAFGQEHDHGSDAAAATQESDGQAQPEPDIADHSGHERGAAEADPHAGHVMPVPGAEPASDPHAGHAMPEVASGPGEDAHAGHAPAPVSSTDGTPPVASPPPEALSGPEHAADAIFGEGAMALARRAELAMHGGATAYLVLIERLEARFDGENGYLLDGQAWYGGDIDRLLLKVEGEGAFEGGFEGAETQALWSHAISPWFDLQTGARFDVGRGEDRGHLVVGVQGLAPYWIELEAAAFLSEDGDLTAAVEVEHDMRITQRLILQPRAELSFAAQDIPDLRVGAGVTEVAVGLRLRYQVLPRFAPYLGAEYTARVGETADRARAWGEDPNRLSFLVGVRTWF